MTKKILTMLTIDDLVKFCEQQNFEKFNSNESGYKICVQVPSTFSVESDNQLPEGITKLKIKILHTDKNRNGSFVSKESAEEAMKNTFECVPILAAIHQLSDGSYDFAGHEIDIVENDKGQAEVEYIEKQVGSFTHDAPWFEYDEENDKEYVCAYAGIPNEYTRTVDILNDKDKKTWVSSELSINKFSWNAKEKYLILEEWYLSGCTLLGTTMDDEEEVKPGMIGAEASIVDFSTENNSVLNNVIESNALDDKNMGNQVQKGGEKPMNKFEELLEKYGKTAEDITFDYDGLTDEELEAKFAAEFDEGESNSEELDDAAEETTEEFEEEVTEEESAEEETEPVVATEYSVNFSDGSVKTFGLTLDEMQFALYNLVNDTYSEADNAWYNVIVDVDDNKVIMNDWWNGNAYRQSFERVDDKFALVGERVAVHSIWVTDEEESAINNMKSNYSKMETELNEYKEKELNASKDALLNSESYSSIVDTDEYQAIISEDNKETFAAMSASELEDSLDKIMLKYAKAGKLAFASKTNDNTPSVKGISLPVKTPAKRGRYGGLV